MVIIALAKTVVNKQAKKIKSLRFRKLRTFFVNVIQ